MLRPRGSLAEAAESEREVGAIDGHALEKILGEGFITFGIGEEAKLPAEAGPMRRLKLRSEGGQSLCR